MSGDRDAVAAICAITIALDGSVPQTLVTELTEDSFDLVAPRKR